MESRREKQETTVKRYLIMFIVKTGLGVTLLVCAVMAVGKTRNQKDGFGPPYYAGAFVVGPLETIAGLTSLLIYRAGSALDPESSDTSTIQTYGTIEVGCSVVALLGCFVGVFFAGIFGVPECDPNEFGSHCNYTKNMKANRSLAIGILMALLASVVMCIYGICVVARHGTYLFTKDSTRAMHTATPLVIVGNRPVSHGNITHGTVMHPPVSNYGVETTHYPTPQPTNYQSATINPPTPMYTGTSSTTPQYTHTQSESNETIRQLQEQNRLLQEQVALQQQHFNLQQQSQHDGTLPGPGNHQLPPSYEDCIGDPAQINILHEQNKALQEKYSQQQTLSEKPLIPTVDPDSMIEPSAPPEQT